MKMLINHAYVSLHCLSDLLVHGSVLDHVASISSMDEVMKVKHA
jgi:hypothetical protein